MHEAVGVRVGDGVGNLDRRLDGTLHVERPAGHLGAQRLPFQELERQIDAAVVLAGVEERGDVGVRQHRHGARLRDERGARVGAGREVGGQQAQARPCGPSRVSRAR